MRGGETIDARKDPGQWMEAGYDDSAWKQALEVAPPLGQLSAQALPPIRSSISFTMPPDAHWKIVPGAGLLQSRCARK